MTPFKPWDPAPNCIFSHKKKIPPPPDLISICLTHYNYTDYVIECLDSLAEQTHKALDLVFIDDASTQDNAIPFILSWLESNKNRFYRIAFLENKYNQGPSFSRNMAFKHALAPSVFIIDADNMLYPEALEKLYATLQHGNFPAVYCQLEEFGDRTGIGRADIWDPDLMRKANYVDVMALVCKAAWQQVGGFSHIEEGWEDYDFWLKFIDHNLEPAYLPEILCRYRVHENSRTAREALRAHHRLELIMAFRHPTPLDKT
ncbi:glycosyltransferase family 2 protein [Acetobacter orientalis]|uniref:glycosyltransferase family 2 protein n=1 Tax=Acetobacter orientalis TaxID=146474 RepID=UPI002651F1E3|nr:glycosyltransferase family 2 protein [Acetobacter sp.]